jgi:hypothetical protein
MALQMVDRDQRQVAGQGHGLAEAEAHHDPADQTGAGGGGHAVQLAVAQSPASVIARRVTPSIISTWLRAAISGTTPPKAAWSSIWLCTTEDRTVAVAVRRQAHDRGGGLVATGLETEHDESQLRGPRLPGSFSLL